MTEELTTEQAAHVLGMKSEEVVDLVPTDGGTVATTHDGQKSLIRDDGTVHALGGPPPVAEQPDAVSVAISAHLPVDAIVDVDLPGYTLDEVAVFVAERYDLDETDVKAALAEEFGETLPPIEHTPPVPQVDRGTTAAPVDPPVPAGPADGEQVVDPEAVPVGTNADVVLEWVGTDKNRARLALDVEATRPTSRGTLVTKLTKVVEAE